MLALLAAHEFIDRRGGPAIGRSFGVNAIAAYAGAWLMTCLLEGLHWGQSLYRVAFEWMLPITGPYVPSLAYACAFVGVWWVIVVWLDRRKLYFKI